MGGQSEITALKGWVEKKQGLGAWKWRVASRAAKGVSTEQWGGGDSVVPFIILIVIASLVLPFV